MAAISILESVRDERGQIVDFVFRGSNPAAAQLMRVPAQELQGKQLLNVWPGTKSVFYPLYVQVVETGQALRIQRYYPFDGYAHWFDISAVKNGDGFIMTFQDITTEKQAEQEVLKLKDELTQQATDKYLTLFNSIDEGFGILEVLFEAHDKPVDFRWLEVNPQFEQLTSLPRAEVLSGKTIRQITANLKETWLQHYGSVALTGEPVRFEEESQLVDRWFELYAFRVGAPQQRQVAVLFNDITKRKLAEQALRKSEEQFRTVANMIPDLLWRSDPQSNTSWYNHRWFDYTGQTPEEAAGYGWANVIHPEDRGRAVQNYRTAVLKGHPLRQEHRIRNTQGNYRWFQAQALPIRDGNGEIVQWFGAAIDIHDRKLAEEAIAADKASLEQQVAERTKDLRENRDLLQSVYDTSLIGMSVLQAVRNADGTVTDFRIISVNKQLEREMGRTDLVGKLYMQEYPGIVSGLLALMLRTLETGEPQYTEYYYPYDSFNKWFSCMFVKRNDGLVATSLDITARKEAEEERFKNLALVQQAEAVAQLGSWEYDVVQDVMHWSEGMYRLFGMPRGVPVSPQVYLDFVIEEDRPVAESLLHKLKQEPTSFEKWLRLRIAGQVRTMRIKGELVRDEHQRPVRLLGVDLDISEVRQLEEENLRMRLQQQQELLLAILEAQEEERRRIAESLHNGVAQLLYATQLNLNRVLNVDLGAASGAQTEQALSKAHQLLVQAIQETRRVSHELIPGMLKEHGLENALQDICRHFVGSGLECTCATSLPGRLAPHLEMALYRISQELMNNIAKHAGATRARLEVTQEKAWLYLEAQDNGRGMRQTPVDWGIGLKTIHDRVQLLGGSVEIESSSASGTLITVRIPLTTSESKRAPGQPGTNVPMQT